MNEQAIIAKLKQRRKALGYTQKDIADQLGYGRETISHLERGDAWLRVSKMIAICNVLGVDPATLFEDGND